MSGYFVNNNAHSDVSLQVTQIFEIQSLRLSALIRRFAQCLYLSFTMHDQMFRSLRAPQMCEARCNVSTHHRCSTKQAAMYLMTFPYTQSRELGCLDDTPSASDCCCASSSFFLCAICSCASVAWQDVCGKDGSEGQVVQPPSILWWRFRLFVHPRATGSSRFGANCHELGSSASAQL